MVSKTLGVALPWAPPRLIDPKVPSHVDVVRSHIAGDGGVIVDQIANFEQQRRRVEPDIGLRLMLGFLVDLQQRRTLLGDGSAGCVRQPRTRQRLGQLCQGSSDVAAQFQRGLVVVVISAGTSSMWITVRAGSAFHSRGSYSTGSNPTVTKTSAWLMRTSPGWLRKSPTRPTK